MSRKEVIAFNHYVKALHRLGLIEYLQDLLKRDRLIIAYLAALNLEAFTTWEIQKQTRLPEATAYRSTKDLHELGLIEKIGKADKSRSRGIAGPRPTLWHIVG